MVTRSFRNVLTALVLCGLCFSVRGASAEPAQAMLQTVTPFLYPPYPGSASQESIFDHSTPNYTFDNRIVTYKGDTANRFCPSPAPPGTPPPRAGICNAGQGGYWSYGLGDWVYYDGHDGVDYGISYRPIYAAADANQIVYAGWWDPQNHKINLGIYVRLRHPNGYNTYYGHMSSVSVQACPTVGCTFVPHGEMLGISGTTGNSTGPHLHLLVRNPAGRSVDPYGWTGSGSDPWTHNQPESLWVTYPALEYYGAKIYPTGPELPFPAAQPTGILVDDGSPGFFETPFDCWNDIAMPGTQGGVMRFSRARTSTPSCTGRWSLPAGARAGLYSLYVRIPPDRATSEGAVYTVRHSGRSDTVVVNQAVFPNNYYVRDGWLYIGKYNFEGAGGEYIEVTNRTQDETEFAADRFVGIDAVRFVFQGDVTPTPMTPVTVTSTRTPSITPSPTITRTPTVSRTPSSTPSPTTTRTPTITRTPTVTRTPTLTRTPTRTRTPSRTPTITRTPTATRTRVPTATPLYRLIDVYFASRVRYEQDAPPIERAGRRWVRSSMQPQAALNEYFKGPGSTERFTYGWIALYNGFTGYDRLEIEDGVAHVYLTGACTSEGRDFNIADLLRLTLKQFPEIQFVKIYDQNGQTQNPDGLSDSEPVCLSQFFTATITPTRTPTPSRTPTVTRTPTNTRRPSATPQYTRINVYFVSRYRLTNNLPPFEAAGVRWARSNNIIGTVLDEYFKGPGSTERYSFGWIGIYNGFTGYSRIDIANGIARIYLTGQCEAGESDYNIVDILSYNLKQFPEIEYVKIYDQNGITKDPFGVSDSVPMCLEQ